MALPAFEFATPGALRERLCGLVLAEQKTATFSLAVLDEMYPDTVHPIGSHAAMVSSRNRELGVIEISSRLECRIADVTWDMVAAEGENDTDVAGWRRGHESFWAQFIDEIRAHTNDPHWKIDDETIVVYETFRLIERLPAADEARYPVVELLVPRAELEIASAELFDLDTVGIEEVSDEHDLVRLRAGFASEVLATAAEAALPHRWTPSFEVIVGDDWLDAWRDHIEPVTVGRLTIVPAWHATGHPRDDNEGITLLLDARRSFGTGDHASTRLALELLQTIDLRGARVLDVGCGSGVLGVAAALLGSAQVCGVDVEPPALRTFIENAERNGVADLCRADHSDVRRVSGTFDVVLANILAPILIDLAPLVRDRIAENGVLILAGLIEPQRERVLAAYEPLHVVTTRRSGEWVGLALSR
jgi:ribosomal protein L11 methyltransferase